MVIKETNSFSKINCIIKEIDDCVYRLNKGKIDEILDSFNSCDDKFKFTYYRESDNFLNSFNVKITHQGSIIQTNWYINVINRGSHLYYFSDFQIHNISVVNGLVVYQALKLFNVKFTKEDLQNQKYFRTNNSTKKLPNRIYQIYNNKISNNKIYKSIRYVKCLSEKIKL